MSWIEENEWEAKWWGDCVNTIREELLQFTYAKRMGLEIFNNGRSDFNIDLHGDSIIDIGGGPVSLLLKCVNGGVRTVVDPCVFPMWIAARYACAGVNYITIPAESFKPRRDYQEVWIYNVLQHTISPKEVIENAKLAAHRIRIFEWIDAGISSGHPHELKEDQLNEWLGGKGTVEQIDEHSAIGKCYYGVFDVA